MIALFEDGTNTVPVNAERVTSKLYQQIGQLTVELEWLKKNLEASANERRLWISPERDSLST